jgi:hypothetical protein
MNEFPLELIDGHVVIRSDGRALLLDTGSPVTLSHLPLSFLGQEWPVEAEYFGASTEDLSQHAGVRIDVLLGANVLSRFAVAVDTRTNRVVFNSQAILHADLVVPLETLMGIPVMEVGLGGRPLRMWFDTGAPLSYLRAAVAASYPVIRHAQDFYPGVGRFTTAVHRVPLTVRDHAIAMDCGTLPPVLEAGLLKDGVNGIVGTELLNSFGVEWTPGFGELRLRIPERPGETTTNDT